MADVYREILSRALRFIPVPDWWFNITVEHP